MSPAPRMICTPIRRESICPPPLLPRFTGFSARSAGDLIRADFPPPMFPSAGKSAIISGREVMTSLPLTGNSIWILPTVTGRYKKKNPFLLWIIYGKRKRLVWHCGNRSRGMGILPRTDHYKNLYEIVAAGDTEADRKRWRGVTWNAGGI